MEDLGSRASADTQSPGDRRRTSGAPSDRGQASAPAARGAPGSGGPDAPKICALDDPNDRRHPDAEFSCVTCNREFCGLCRGDDGDCYNCQFLKMKCWACRENAQEVSMYFCTDCGTHVCENHSYFGNDGLERCARCNIRHERAQAGPPPPPPPGGGGGQGGPPGQGGSGSGGHGHAPLPPPGPGHPGKVPLDLLEGRVEGLLPGDTQVEHPGSVVVLVALNNKVKVMVCGPGRSLDREGDQGVHMTKKIQHKMGDLRANLIPVVSADAVSWGSEVDSYGRNRPVQRAWAVVPPYLAAVPDFFSLTRTTWPGSVTLHIRDNILKLLKEGTSSKMGDGGSMSESEDVDMTGAALGGPPVGVAPGGQSSDAGQQVEGQIAAPKAPPKALVTKEMLASVRPKSPPNPPRSPRVSSPQVTATEVGNRWSSSLRTPRATIEEENAGGSAEVDDLLPDREGVDLPTDTFNDGGDPTKAEVLESAGDVEMEPEKEAEAPAVGEEETPGREAEVPQATTTTTEPSVESPAAKRAASPVREERRAREPVGDQKKEEASGAGGPGAPISYAPKYTDDDGDLRDTAATPKAASTQESRGGIHNYANTPYPEHPGEAPELESAEVRHHREHGSYQSTRGSRTSGKTGGKQVE